MPDLPPIADEDHNREYRRQLKLKYGAFYSAIEALFFRYDPMDINYETNTDEYDPEVSSVLPRLGSCVSPTDVQRVLHEEFTRWFGDAGPPDHYASIAVDLWQLWNDFDSNTRNA
jgi:lysyl-tRNA synthetase class I